MDTNVLNFIRDRFNTLETNMAKGFDDVKETMSDNLGGHDVRIRSLEDDRTTKNAKLVAYGTVGGTIGTLGIWLLGKIF